MTTANGIIKLRRIKDLQLLHGAGAVFRHHRCTVGKGDGLGRGRRGNAHDAQPNKKANHRCSPYLQIFESMARLTAYAIASG